MTRFYVKDWFTGERVEELSDVLAAADRVEQEFDISFERWLMENDIDTESEYFDAEREYAEYRDMLIIDILCGEMFGDFIEVVEEEE